MKYHIEYDLDFKRNMGPGKYIVLEGVNACGKTTQVAKLKQYFEEQGHEVVITSEPNENQTIGKMVREIITGNKKISRLALQYLYTADRLSNYEEVIIPSLAKGKIVLASRNFWSAVVYGIVDMGKTNYTRENTNLILASQGILSMYSQCLIPDLTLYLRTDVETVLTRMDKMGGSRDIYEKREKLTQIISGYDFVAKVFDKEIIEIDGNKLIDEVTKDILKYTKRTLDI